MRISVAVLCSTALLALVGAAQAADIRLTDWTRIEIGEEFATGTLGDIKVRLAGSDIAYGVSDGTYTGFNTPDHVPPVAYSDMVEFRGTLDGARYTVDFSWPVADPILYFTSLASTLTFSTPHITRLSGDPTFTVKDNVVDGVFDNGPFRSDSAGVIQLRGLFDDFSFTALFPDSSAGDGIAMQIAVPEPETTSLLLGSMLISFAAARRRRARCMPQREALR